MRYRSLPVWKQAPFIRLITPLALGVAFALLCPLKTAFAFGMTGCILAAMSLLAIMSTRQHFQWKYLHGLMINLLLCGCGFIVVSSKQQSPPKSSASKVETYIATLSEPLARKTNSYRALATCIQVTSSDLVADKQFVQLYFDTAIIKSEISYGSQVVFTKALQSIRTQANPGSFDYQQYSARKGIYYQVFLSETDFYILPEKHGSYFQHALIDARLWCIKVIKQYISGSKEAGLAEALLIGYKHDLDPELLKSYTNTGVVHLIAISGLHLGLIYMILRQLCFYLRIRKKLLRGALILAALWGFSFLVGGGPSVFRSAVMFSFIVVGECLSRRIPILNSLAGSAFLLLCIYPNYLFDAGFQLSYAAVLSLILFVKPITNLAVPRNPALESIWKLASVTIAAQLLTLPFCLYYFHQFPNTFLITNIVAVPISSLILLFLILLCCLSSFQLFAIIIGEISTHSIWLMNGIIEHTEKIPFSTWNGIKISLVQAFCLAALIYVLAQWLYTRRKSWLWLSFSLILIFSAIRVVDFYQASQQLRLIVYNVRGKQLIQIVNGRSSKLIGNPDLTTFEKTVQPASEVFRIRRTEIHPYKHCNKQIVIGQTRFVVIETDPLMSTDFLQPQLIIVSHTPRIKIADLKVQFNPNSIILDGSNTTAKVRNWQKEADVLAVPIHSTADKGAFVLKLN